MGSTVRITEGLARGRSVTYPSRSLALTTGGIAAAVPVYHLCWVRSVMPVIAAGRRKFRWSSRKQTREMTVETAMARKNFGPRSDS